MSGFHHYLDNYAIHAAITIAISINVHFMSKRAKLHFQYIFNTNTIQNRKFFENFQNIARIEADEAETWSTVRFEHAEPEDIY